jgi:GH15 family glucan-1,4-alpha-glucosidase
MSATIGDHALIGDGETAALVQRDGTIDWLCWPRFDSEACFAALLGEESCGCWSMAPCGAASTSRHYRDDTLILETRFEGDDGVATVVDFMPLSDGGRSDLVRIVIGESGRVPMRSALRVRFDFGRLWPWPKRLSDCAVEFIAGPHAVVLESPVPVGCDDRQWISDFVIGEGERKCFVLRYRASHLAAADPLDGDAELASTERAWRKWSSQCVYEGRWRDAVVRSLITIKALTARQTGGVIAAPTTSLPEKIGGERNWDYRFCWLRDATFTLLALLHSGFRQEAAEWRDWLLRAAAGMPDDLQPIYGVDGEYRLPEWEADWLPGFRGSRPVRIGNAAYQQFQLDIYGEIFDTLHQSRERGMPPEDHGWYLQKKLIDHVEQVWREPDSGIWEARHGRENFTHSKVMAWVAIDRAIHAAENHALDWPITRWRNLRCAIHEEVCGRGFDRNLGAFVRSYETHEPDAATLLIPLLGFLPADDPRVRGTVKLIESKLMPDGFVRRYDPARSRDGMQGKEGAFLACGFWYIDNLLLQGRKEEAHCKFEEYLGVRNDLGLLSEEYDPATGECLGNFPQALSHVSLINSAQNLANESGPAHQRSKRKRDAPVG